MALSKNTSLILTLCAMATGMFLLAFASVPLYRMFCSVTGYGGTTQEAKAAPAVQGTKEIIVQFNTDIDPNLPWKFKPVQHQVKVRTGEQKLIFFSAENLTDHTIKGMATYNVSPDSVGVYFNKIQCFCFDQQTLKPNEKVTMPVTFYVDPEIEKDPYLRNIKTITLSYTFFKVKES